MRVFSRLGLVWKSDTLRLGGSSKVLACVITDTKYPTMWRVQMPDGRVTDMVNRTRAKEAATLLVLESLNAKPTVEAPRAGARGTADALKRVPKTGT